MRKDPEERKDEMIDAAERLFSAKGYQDTSVDDICDELGVAHGLFYYYFDSKEDVIKALTERFINELESNLEQIVKDQDLKADEKFLKFLNLSFQRKKKRPYLASYFSREDSPKIYYTLFNETVEALVPFLTQIVEQGVEEEVFNTEFPEQTILFWLNGRLFLFDQDRFEENKFFEDIKAEAYLLERLLGTEDDFLTDFYEEHENEIEDFIEEVNQGD